MFTCEKCGDNNFEVHDGLYFCEGCHTQSQDFVEEAVTEEYAFSLLSSGSHLSRRRIFERKGTKRRELNQGNDWTTFEAYNLILKKQVDVLESIGASSKFKTVVRDLWFAYLRMLGLFSEGNTDFMPKLQLCPRKRDYDVLLHKRRMVSPAKLYESQNRYRERRLRLSGFAVPKSKPVVTNEDEENGRESPLNQSIVSEFGYLSDSTGSNLSSVTKPRMAPFPCRQIAYRHYKNRKNKQPSTDIYRMRLSHTICFLYLGALLSKEQFLLSDIIRWAVEGHLPFYDAAVKVLPKEFKFQTWDNTVFRLKSMISSEFILSRCMLLVKFLGLKNIPVKPIERIAARFILELDLPVKLIGIVSTLIHLAKKLGRAPLVPDYECRAVACILTTLKLMFGFDGTTEILLSNFAKLLNSKDDGSEYFVFTDWCQKVYVLNETRKNSIPHSLRVRKLHHNVNAAEVAAYLLSEAAPRRGRFVAKRMEKYEKKTKDIIAALSKPFKSLHEMDYDNGASSTKKPVSACFLPKDVDSFAKQYGESTVNASCRMWCERKFSPTCLEFIADQDAAKFDEPMQEFLGSLNKDNEDVTNLLKPWTRFKAKLPKNPTSGKAEDDSLVFASYHFSLLLDVFSNILMVRQSTLLRQVYMVEKIFFQKRFSSDPPRRQKKPLGRKRKLVGVD